MIKASPFRQALWRRFRKNKGGVFGLVMILISVIIALFCYFIAPDNSPYANRIILEIGGEKPGFRQSFLLVIRPQRTANFLEQAINGKRDQVEYIPIQSWKENKDSIIAEKYIDEGLTERISYSKLSLAPHPVFTQKFLLGSDKFGRDILSRLIIGTRISLSVGLITVLISLTIGIILGAVAGYFKGRTDDIIM